MAYTHFMRHTHPPGSVPIRQTPWLRVTRERLAERWARDTGHLPGIHRHQPKWAQELANACSLVQGHLSLPCSLTRQADHIGVFLVSPTFDSTPELFLKMYVMLLGEFSGQLADVAGLMKLNIGKPPRLTAVWTNCWAKHALRVLVQHHPTYVFADDLGPEWAKYDRSVPTLKCQDPEGNRVDPEIIDTNWMCEAGKCVDVSFANDGRPPVIVVPPLDEFLRETVAFFRRFIDEALTDPCRIQMFETRKHIDWIPVIDNTGKVPLR